MKLFGDFDNGLTEKQTDICECRVAFATEKFVVGWGGVVGGLFDYSVYSWPKFNQYLLK